MTRIQNTETICREWETERLKHPFFGENKSEKEIRAVWDSAAEKYSDKNYNLIKEEIIDFLCSEYDLKDKTLVDIGCGPGTYALPLSRRMKSILCVDQSRDMLDRLRDTVKEEGIVNIECTECDCRAMPPDFRRNVAFTSLCPPMNNPESVLGMERYADDLCIYISSANRDSSVETEIWKRLGRDYHYGGYHTEYPYMYLRSVGRKPTVKYFSQKISEAESFEEAAERFKTAFGKYLSLTDEITEIIEDAVRNHSVDGFLRTERDNVKGLLVWVPERNRN